MRVNIALLSLDLLVIAGFLVRAWQLERVANRWLDPKLPFRPWTSLNRPEHFLPGGEPARRRADRFARWGFAGVVLYLSLRAVTSSNW